MGTKGLTGRQHAVHAIGTVALTGTCMARGLGWTARVPTAGAVVAGPLVPDCILNKTPSLAMEGCHHAHNSTPVFTCNVADGASLHSCAATGVVGGVWFGPREEEAGEGVRALGRGSMPRAGPMPSHTPAMQAQAHGPHPCAHTYTSSFQLHHTLSYILYCCYEERSGHRRQFPAPGMVGTGWHPPPRPCLNTSAQRRGGIQKSCQGV